MFFRKKKKEEQEKLNAKVEEFLKAGIVYYKKQKYSDAKRYFQKVLTLDSTHKDAQEYLNEAVKREVLQKKKQVVNPQQDVPQSSSSQSIQKNSSSESNEEGNETKDKLYYYKVLRIDSDANEAEVKRRISQEFKKWRTRVNSPDLKTRYEAEKMLNTISNARKYLLNK